MNPAGRVTASLVSRSIPWGCMGDVHGKDVEDEPHPGQGWQGAHGSHGPGGGQRFHDLPGGPAERHPGGCGRIAGCPPVDQGHAPARLGGRCCAARPGDAHQRGLHHPRGCARVPGPHHHRRGRGLALGSGRGGGRRQVRPRAGRGIHAGGILHRRRLRLISLARIHRDQLTTCRRYPPSPTPATAGASP